MLQPKLGSELSHPGMPEQGSRVLVAPVSLLVSRLVVLVLEGVVITTIIGVLMSWVLGVHLPLRLVVALPAALTIVDIIGFTLLLGGLALTLPQTGVIVSLFNGLIFLLNGTLIPLEWYPTWVQKLKCFIHKRQKEYAMDIYFRRWVRGRSA